MPVAIKRHELTCCSAAALVRNRSRCAALGIHLPGTQDVAHVWCGFPCDTFGGVSSGGVHLAGPRNELLEYFSTIALLVPDAGNQLCHACGCPRPVTSLLCWAYSLLLFRRLHAGLQLRFVMIAGSSQLIDFCLLHFHGRYSSELQGHRIWVISLDRYFVRC